MLFPFPCENLYTEKACNGYTTYTDNNKDHSLASYYVKDYSRTLFTCCSLINLILSAKTIGYVKREKKKMTMLIDLKILKN